jgi:phage baseplate assembly protein W
MPLLSYCWPDSFGDLVVYLIFILERLMSDIDHETGKLIERPEAIRQAVKNILRTRQGERLFNAEFGISFQNKDGTAKPGISPEDVRRECISALARYEPRIESINVGPSFDSQRRLQSVSVSFVDAQDHRADSVVVEYRAWSRRSPA